ncbi:hypothetical protein G6F68_014487 [Rhizopus microsporus]|nr:hypothetical protein G6F68_014487 [Rhizopus microsporus]
MGCHRELPRDDAADRADHRRQIRRHRRQGKLGRAAPVQRYPQLQRPLHVGPQAGDAARRCHLDRCARQDRADPRSRRGRLRPAGRRTAVLPRA